MLRAPEPGKKQVGEDGDHHDYDPTAITTPRIPHTTSALVGYSKSSVRS